jgi:hypothetical protein
MYNDAGVNGAFDLAADALYFRSEDIYCRADQIFWSHADVSYQDDELYFLGSGRSVCGYYADIVLNTPDTLPTTAGAYTIRVRAQTIRRFSAKSSTN